MCVAVFPKEKGSSTLDQLKDTEAFGPILVSDAFR